MTTITIDTHQAFRTLVSKGVPEKQAEGHIEIFQQAELSGVGTKDDISSIKEDISGLKDDISNLRADLYKFILINNVALAGLIVTLIKLI